MRDVLCWSVFAGGSGGLAERLSFAGIHWVTNNIFSLSVHFVFQRASGRWRRFGLVSPAGEVVSLRPRCCAGQVFPYHWRSWTIIAFLSHWVTVALSYIGIHWSVFDRQWQLLLCLASHYYLFSTQRHLISGIIPKPCLSIHHKE